ncbi:MAG: DNA starvation/stationary phase protection protein [Proteobacteria bacterium]|nr:DNA starvation/stationary phase protection protein [Pseudomonadota bacterium]
MPKGHDGKVAAALAQVLADTYTLYLKTHAFHWNVEGPHFYALHGMFEGQYKELWAAIDELAERIRALGVKAPASGAALAKLASVAEAQSVPSALSMVAELHAGHQATLKTIWRALKVAQAEGDEGTADMLIGRIEAHDKTAWTLASTLKKA